MVGKFFEMSGSGNGASGGNLGSDEHAAKAMQTAIVGQIFMRANPRQTPP
jgi:hypothetical protein